MPELPDLTIVAEAFDAALRGRRITAATAPGPLAVRGTPDELASLVGQAVTRIEQRGKFLVVELDRDRIVVNPMLTGRFQLAAPGAKHPTKTAVIVGFGEAGPAKGFKPAALDTRCDMATGSERSPRDPLSRPHADGQGLPITERSGT